jgi:hypothetical protein
MIGTVVVGVRKGKGRRSRVSLYIYASAATAHEPLAK